MKDPATRVLLVDDDEDDQAMFLDSLTQVRGQKFKVDWAPSYTAGVDRLLNNEYDICFIDYRLGGKTGLDFLKEVVAKGCEVPIIMLTGYGEHEIDLKAMEYGASDYFVKDEATPFLLERSIRYSIHRAKAQQAIREREAQILVQDRMASVGLLASSLAHEIGTPLGVIRGRAEYLELQLDNPAVKKNVAVIISQIDRVSQLIRSLLNLARGGQKQDLAAVSAAAIAAEVADLMGHEFRKHEIEFRNELGTEVHVKAEPGPFHQVLLNLFINSMHAIESIKRIPPGGNFIRIFAEDAEGIWTLGVQDTGCGISEANRKNLFKPFFTTKDIGVGTGLGLATSYRIIESWGGKIEVDSEEGKGATFRIRLPRA